ncbi:MAG: hypothetical protein GY861_17270 [bacterium]|nr:hypothetical protein [bacterium]
MTMNFKEEVFELAFGDNAINKDYSEEEVLKKLREFSDKALKYEEENKMTITKAMEDALYDYIVGCNLEHSVCDDLDKDGTTKDQSKKETAQKLRVWFQIAEEEPEVIENADGDREWA